MADMIPKNTNQAIILMMEGLVTHFPPTEQEKFKECSAKLEAIIKEYGEIGELAASLLGVRITEKE